MSLSRTSWSWSKVSREFSLSPCALNCAMTLLQFIVINYLNKCGRVIKYKIKMGNQIPSSPNQALQKLQQHFKVVERDEQTGIMYLSDRKTGHEFILRELLSNQQSQTLRIERLVDQKYHDKNPYLVRLSECVCEKETNYCSYSFKAYLMFGKPGRTLRTDILQRKMKHSPYQQEDILGIIQAVTQGLRYLKQIGQQHGVISSSSVFVSSLGNVLLSDPWMNPDHYKVTDHSYNSPEKVQQKQSMRQQEVDWLASDLFALGILVLECLELEYMDDLYQRGRGINYQLMNSRVARIKWPLIKMYVTELLGAEKKRAAVIYQIEALIVSRKQRGSLDFPTVHKGNGKIQLSQNVGVPQVKHVQTLSPLSQVRQQVGYRAEMQQKPYLKVQNRGQLIQKGSRIYAQQKMNGAISATSMVVNRKHLESGKNINNLPSSYVGAQMKHLALSQHTVVTTHPNNTSNAVYRPMVYNPSVPKLQVLPSTSLTGLNGSMTERVTQIKSTLQPQQNPPSMFRNRTNKSCANLLALAQPQLFNPYQTTLKGLGSLNKPNYQLINQESGKLGNSFHRMTTQTSMVKSTNLVSSMAKVKTVIGIEEQVSITSHPIPSYSGRLYNLEKTPQPAQNNNSTLLSTGQVNRTPTRPFRQIQTLLPGLSKEFSFAPEPSPSKNYLFGTSDSGFQNVYVNNSSSRSNSKVTQNTPQLFLGGQLTQYKYELPFELTASNKKDTEKAEVTVTICNLSDISKDLKQQFDDQNISTIEPQRDTVKTPERTGSSKSAYINPFELQTKESKMEQYKVDEATIEFENVKAVVSFQQKKHGKKYNSTIIEVSDSQDQSVVSNADTEYVTQQYEIGSKYNGFKKNGQRNGKGIFMYKDGGYYEGNWRDNQMHGQGKLFYPSGKLAYDGGWSEDEFSGFGKVFNDNSNPSVHNIPFDYTDFNDLDDVWEYYQGQLKSDIKQGKGKIKFSNGEQFQGLFRDDKMDGQGKFTTLAGGIITGVWRNSKLVRVIQS